MKFLFLIVLVAISCADSKEWSTKKIIRLDKQHKLSDAISQIDSMDELNTLMSLLTDDQKKDYLSYTAQKEQELRFPRPTPMTIEYLDSITNLSVMSNIFPDVDSSLFIQTNMEINERLILVEDGTLGYQDDQIVLQDYYAYSTMLSNEVYLDDELFSCHERLLNLFYDSIYYDPLTFRYYYGEASVIAHTNLSEFQAYNNTNKLILLSNSSPSNKVYYDPKNHNIVNKKIRLIFEIPNLLSRTPIRHTNESTLSVYYYYIGEITDEMSRHMWTQDGKLQQRYENGETDAMMSCYKDSGF